MGSQHSRYAGRFCLHPPHADTNAEIGIACAAIEIMNLVQVGDLFFTSNAGLYHALGLAPLIIASSVGSPILAAFIQAGGPRKAHTRRAVADPTHL